MPIESTNDSINESVNAECKSAYNYIVQICFDVGIIPERALTEQKLRLILDQLLQQICVSGKKV